MSEPRDQSFSAVPPPPAAPRPLPAAGWFPDPGGRHEHRYWDGAAWTDHVADRGVAGLDAVVAAPPVVASPQPAMTSAALSGVAPPPSVPTNSDDWFTLEPPRYGPLPGPVRSLAGLCTALTVLLWAAVGIAAVGVIAYLTRVAAVSDMIDALDSGTFSEYADAHGRAEDADAFVGIVTILLLVLGITIFVLLIIWMWRLAKNAELLGRSQPRFTPGWTIGGWFIPLASLVIPVLVMQDLWRGSDPDSPRGDPQWRSRPGSALVGWWWAFWVAEQVLQVAGSNDGDAVSRSELTSLRTQDIVSAFGVGAALAASILLILVVRRLTRRQQDLVGAIPPVA